ncbi:GNAT family N-acetyltransferase [Dokdonella sp.]|uniref:GNAT family N-acetyltransferase n=1 Tax=Dokdonella sp. TaxID=2291710 RepID=UPI002F3E423D
METGVSIGLARADEALAMALQSRELVEHGLRWRWTPERLRRAIAARDTNVAVARVEGGLVGFGVMQYLDEEARLCLLAVRPGSRRQGTGTKLVRWLEAAALEAGIGVIRLEARRRNAAARAFYRRLGYEEVMLSIGYYAPHEDAVRFAKDLWLAPPTLPPA